MLVSFKLRKPRIIGTNDAVIILYGLNQIKFKTLTENCNTKVKTLKLKKKQRPITIEIENIKANTDKNIAEL